MGKDEASNSQTQENPQGSGDTQSTERPAPDPDLSDYFRRDQNPSDIIKK